MTRIQIVRTQSGMWGMAAFAVLFSMLWLLPFARGPVSTVARMHAPIMGRHVEGEVLVRFNAGIDRTEAKAVLARRGMTILRSYAGMSNLYHVGLQPGQTVEAALEVLKGEPDVQFGEPNSLFEFTSACPPSCSPNDPEYMNQWGLANIRAPEAWAVTQGSPDVVVAVQDTGIDYNHPDLAANIWTNPVEIPGNGIDDDGNGYIDDIHGYNATTDPCDNNGCLHQGGDPMDDASYEQGHGTRTAGIIGAAGNNGIGIAGVNWHVKLMIVKVSSEPGSPVVRSGLAAILAGTDYVLTQKKRGVFIPVMSMSYTGDPGDYPSMQVMIDAARDAGILLISTAGNSATNVDLVPDDFHNHVYDNVLFTAAIDSNNQLASFSSYGDVSIHLAAPGVGILSTIRSVYPALYGSSDGTSYAAPFVIGVAALLAAVNPNITYTQLKARIISATTAMPDQMNKIASGGRLNAAGVFSAPITDLLPPPYQLARLGEGKRYYLDRTYTISETPLGFDGLWWVRTRNDDKGNADENFIQIGLGHEATVYVAFGLSATELPNWLRPSADWTNTGRLLGTDVLGKTGYDTLYSRPFNPGMVTLGGPLAAGYVGPLPPDNSNYTVFIRLYTGNVDKSGVSTNRLDGYDLVFFNLAMGSSVGAANFCAACDLDGSGTIDSVDLSLFMDNFGKSM